jgi:dCMP deaminase
MNYHQAMSVALDVARASNDRSTQNGAVILGAPNGASVISRACNRFPDGVGDTEESGRWERPGKYLWVEHAERNAIYKAAASGLALDGTTMVCHWAACADCARAIVQAKIMRLVRFESVGPIGSHWNESISVGDTMMEEAGVEIIELDVNDFTLRAGYLRRDGKPWPDPSVDVVTIHGVAAPV